MGPEFALRSLVADWREEAGEHLYARRIVLDACADQLEQLIEVLYGSE